MNISDRLIAVVTGPERWTKARRKQESEGDNLTRAAARIRPPSPGCRAAVIQKVAH